MATYNGAAFVREQLDSILAQTRLPDELVVCDDCSTDETVQILREYAERSRVPIRIFVNDANLRSTKNFEKAIGLCTGDIIALSDQDDVWMPHKLQIIERRFASEPDLGLVFSNGFLIDESGGAIPGDMWSRWRFNRGLQNSVRKGRKAYELLVSRHFMTGATMAFRSSLRTLILPIPDGLDTFIHDRWIAVIVAGVARVSAIEDKLIAYRLHPQQQMGVGRTAFQEFVVPAHCSSDRRALDLILGRLSADEKVDPEFLRTLDARRRHLAAREAVSGNLVGRFQMVAREYLSGRYLRYSFGTAQAVRDVLVGTR